MLDILLRLFAEVGPGVTWIAVFLAAVVIAFVLYVGIAMLAIFRAQDSEQIKVRYRVFSDLLSLFHRRRRR